MRIDLVYPTLPPTINGIGDHTVLLAQALVGAGHEVRVLTRSDPIRDPLPAGVTGVDVWAADAGPTIPIGPLLKAIAAHPPDAVLLQFEQFSYGPRGFNPRFALLFARLRRRRLPTVAVLYAHETYVTPDRLRWLPIWAFQRAQFALLARTAAVVCVAAEAWVGRVERLGQTAEVIPIFANIPVLERVPPTAVERGDGAVALWFGYLDARRVPSFDATVRALEGVPGSMLVYAGKDHALAAERLSGRGLAYEVVSDPSPGALSSLLRAADVVVAPFPDGVSGRRSSFLAAIAHGARVVTTLGSSTDGALRTAATDDLFAAVEVGDDDGFGAALQRELARPRLRASRSDPVDPAVVAFYADRYSPERAAARITELIERVGGAGRAEGLTGR